MSVLEKRPLPPLPVPTIEHCKELLLRSSSALLTEEEMKTFTALANEFFSSNVCRQLQEALEQKKLKEPTSWLKRWWELNAYLTDRSPIAINSNYVMLLGLNDEICNPIARAARLACGAREFADMIEANRLPLDTLRGKPLCMRQYKHVFRTCRIPGLEVDQFFSFENSRSRHIVVLRRGYFFVVNVYDELGGPLSVAHVEKQLQAVVDIVDSERKTKEAPLLFSNLTATERSGWSKLRNEIISFDPLNRENLSLIETSLFVVSLDHRCPSSPSESGRYLLHGEGKGTIFFDKSVNFVVFENGLGGMNMEHSPSDAPIVAAMADYALKRSRELVNVPSIFSNDKKHSPLLSYSVPKPREITFRLAPSMTDAIKSATVFAEREAKNLNVNVLRFSDYGTNSIKQWKVSPDAWAQMAMLLAFYRQHGTLTAVYETGSTRKFDFGRTETIRSCSVEAKNWILAMYDNSKPLSEKKSLLMSALDYHGKYTGLANNALGVDRHLLGMRCISKEINVEMPPFLVHPLLKRSNYFRLSTSNTTRPVCSGGGFGPVVADGYGICYGLHAKVLQLFITDFENCKETNCFTLGENISRALRDMAMLVNQRHARL